MTNARFGLGSTSDDAPFGDEAHSGDRDGDGSYDPDGQDGPDAASALFARRYRAMSSRDARFDGQFITGVHSTGIYCRPSCPATTPKAQNVSFYLTAAAAHEAGLRACKRCLPDAVPGSPRWNLRDDTASRAMRLIADGVVERDGVSGLSARLGYTPRHLGRILSAELGAGPLALARAHRAQTARTLLLSTDLAIADVAHAAGFSSVRQFNATIVEVYERTPSQLRALGPTGRIGGVPRATTPSTDARTDARADARAAPTSAGAPVLSDARDAQITAAARPVTVRLRLPARPPFDASGVLHFLAARAVRGVESGGPDRYVRTVRLPGGPAVVALAAAGASAAPVIECEATVSDLADLPPLVARVRRLFDLDADAVAIDRTLSADPVLRPLVERHPGVRVPGTVDPWEVLLRALVGQQISVKAARTALSRITDELGERVPFGQQEGVDRLFPSAAAVAEHGENVLRGPARRVQTIIDTAAAVASGEILLDPGRSRASLVETLLARPGIGPWTAGYVAMRVSGAPDILLTSDLVLRQSADALGLPSGERDLVAASAPWAPWRSYAGMHLWRWASDGSSAP